MIVLPAVTQNPFPGLRPFEADEEHLFFGRETQIDDLLARLRRTRFLAVVGTSGSGKSSLVRAGVLPSLHGGFMAGAGSSWRIAVLRPGNRPLASLAAALANSAILADEGSRAETDRQLQVGLIEAVLARGALGLVEVVQQARLRPDENVLILVDQFEELFRFKSDGSALGLADEPAAFVKLLLATASYARQPIYVVLTMRSDFLGDCAQFRDLPETINDGLFLVPRMTRDQLRSAIEGPIGVAGGRIAPRLVTKLLNDLGDEPDQLPVLQHAIMRTWNIWHADHAAGEPLDSRHYAATGGLDEALCRHADEIYLALGDERPRQLAEKLFKCLTDRGTDNRGLRRPTRFRETCAVVGVSATELLHVIDPFRAPDCSFLMPAAGTQFDDETVVDISHESLMRKWRRLQDWVDQEAQSALVYRRLAEAASLHSREQAALWRDPDLSIGLDWRERNRPNAAWAARYDPAFDGAMRFLERSSEARDKEKVARANARRKEVRGLMTSVLLAGLALLVTLVVVIVAFAWHRDKDLRAKAESQANLAKRNATEAQKESRQARQSAVLTTRALRAEISAKSEARAQAAAASAASKAAIEQTRAAQRATKLANDEARKRLVAYQFADAERKRAERAKIAAKQTAEQNLRLAQQNRRLYEAVEYFVKGESASFKGESAAFGTPSSTDLQRSIADYTHAIELAPRYLPAYLSRGAAYQHEGQQDRALADFHTAIALAPDNPLSYYQLGVSYLRKRDYDAAVAAFSDMIRHKDSVLGRLQRGFTYVKKRDFERAVADFTEAMRGDPTHNWSYTQRASAYERQGDYGRALADYTASVKLVPTAGATIADRGDVYLLDGSYESALADYSLAIDKHFFPAYLRRAAAYGGNGESTKAVDDYHSAIENLTGAELVSAYIGLGSQYYSMNRLEDATQSFSQASKLGPRDNFAALWLQLTRFKSGDFDLSTFRQVSFDAASWPAPLFELFRGESTLDDVVRVIPPPDTNDRARECELTFFAGEYALTQRDAVRGRELLAQAFAACRASFPYHFYAAYAAVAGNESKTASRR